jgi:hypothetical protein
MRVRLVCGGGYFWDGARAASQGLRFSKRLRQYLRDYSPSETVTASQEL